MSHRSPASPYERRDSGFALIAGLLLLLVMSLIGVSMMNVTRLETMMAGAARESNIALQAAEAALRDAEANIESTTSIAAFNGGAGMLGQPDDEPNFFETDTTAPDFAWDDDQSIASSGYPEVTAQPRYVIKHVDDIEDASTAGSSISIGGYGTTPPATAAVFRITARGTSRDGASEVLLQSYYGRIY